MLKKIFLVICVLSAFLDARDIEIKDLYVRATPPSLLNTASFLTIYNNSPKDIYLVKAMSNVAKFVELHTHDIKNGVMTMYQVPKINIKANSKTVLKPGGYHIMLIGLYKPLKINDKIKITLTFSNDKIITMSAPVKTVMQGMKTNMIKNIINE